MSCWKLLFGPQGMDFAQFSPSPGAVQPKQVDIVSMYDSPPLLVTKHQNEFETHDNIGRIREDTRHLSGDMCGDSSKSLRNPRVPLPDAPVCRTISPGVSLNHSVLTPSAEGGYGNSSLLLRWEDANSMYVLIVAPTSVWLTDEQ